MPLAGVAKGAEQRASLTVTTGISAADNPFLSTVDQASAMLTEISARPVLTSKSERYAVELSGNLGHRRYSKKKFESYTFGDGGLAVSYRQSERLQFQAATHYRQEISTDVVDDTAAAIDPKSVRKSIGANGSATWQLSEYASLTPGLNFESVTYDRSDQLSPYKRYAGSLDYRRRLSQYTSIGINGGAMRYSHQDEPDATILSAALTFQHSFSPVLEAQGSLGIERAKFGASPTEDSDAKFLFSGNAQLCRRGEYGALCAHSAMSTEPSGSGSIERRFSGGASYDRRLGEFSRLSVKVDYERAEGLRPQLQEKLQYLHANASFDRKINDFLTLNTYLQYRKRGGSQSASSAQAGLNLRFTVGRN